jgi:hypothetical protein
MAIFYNGTKMKKSMIFNLLRNVPLDLPNLGIKFTVRMKEVLYARWKSWWKRIHKLEKILSNAQNYNKKCFCRGRKVDLRNCISFGLGSDLQTSSDVNKHKFGIPNIPVFFRFLS